MKNAQLIIIYNNNMKRNLILLSIILSINIFSQTEKKLPIPINTVEFNEYAPTLSSDGKTMIFQSDRSGKWRLYQITMKDDSTWTNPKSIQAINNYDTRDIFIGYPFLTYDDKFLFFASDMKGSYGSLDIFYSEKINGEWCPPKNAGNQINSKAYEASPSVSPDGKKIYYIMKRLSGKNEEKCYKIYACDKNDENEWINPHALRKPINSTCEDVPRIMYDGKTLIFSSIRQGGYGKFDIYKSIYIEGVGWSEPENMDYANSEFNDRLIALSPNEEYAYYTNDGGFSDDIYYKKVPFKGRLKKKMIIAGNVIDNETGEPIVAQLSITNVKNNKIVTEVYSSEADGSFEVDLPEGEEYKIVIKKGDYVMLEKSIDLTEITIERTDLAVNFNSEEYERTKKKAIVSGTLIDEETGEPIVAKLSITNVRNNKIVTEVYSSETDGSYEVELDKNEDYEIYATAKGVIMEEPIKITNLEKPISFNNPTKLKNITENTNFVLNNIYFDTDSASIKPESYTALNQVVNLLKENKNIKVEISAHTDNVGNYDYNINLSQQRAASVVDYLISNGIPKDNLEAKGYGETKPIATNDTEIGKAKNRRVEFTILKVN